MSRTLGAAQSAAWVEARGLDPGRTPHWYVEITIDADRDDGRLDLNIYPEEWGFVFRRGARVSSIRVTDVPFVHGLDDYQLVTSTPALEHLGGLLIQLEQRFGFQFARTRARVKTNLVRASAVVRPWLLSFR